MNSIMTTSSDEIMWWHHVTMPWHHVTMTCHLVMLGSFMLVIKLHFLFTKIIRLHNLHIYVVIHYWVHTKIKQNIWKEIIVYKHKTIDLTMHWYISTKHNFTSIWTINWKILQQNIETTKIKLHWPCRFIQSDFVNVSWKGLFSI